MFKNALNRLARWWLGTPEKKPLGWAIVNSDVFPISDIELLDGSVLVAFCVNRAAEVRELLIVDRKGKLFQRTTLEEAKQLICGDSLVVSFNIQEK